MGRSSLLLVGAAFFVRIARAMVCRVRPALFLFAAALPIITCGKTVPISSQERWQCNEDVWYTHVVLCGPPCVNDNDCPVLDHCDMTAQHPDVMGYTGLCLPAQGCKTFDFQLSAGGSQFRLTPDSPWTGVACLDKGASPQDAAVCCAKTCNEVLGKFGPVDCIPRACQSDMDCASKFQRVALKCVNSRCEAAPAKTANMTNQTCDNTDILLQSQCSPTKKIPEGQNKARVAASLDSSSTAQVTVNGNKSPVLTPSGVIRYTVEPCGASQCPIHLNDFLFTLPSFTIGGETIDDIVVQTARSSSDTAVDMSTGTFQFSVSAMRVAINFRDNGTEGDVTTRNSQPVGGIVNPTTGAISLSGQLGAQKVTVDLDLHATPFNRPPKAVAKPRGQIECNMPHAAFVELDATASTDPDSNIARKFWFLSSQNNNLVGAGDRMRYELPYGAGTISLQVLDNALADDVDVAPVTVVDTTPPVLEASVSPSCLWSPSHNMVLYELGSGVLTKTTDACDPSPLVEITNVVSSQPSQGGGQGNTDPDVVFGKKAFCVRSERQGTSAVPRIYTITLSAKDFAGNTITKDLMITTDHDQGGIKCPSVNSNRLVADTDPRCIAN